MSRQPEVSYAWNGDTALAYEVIGNGERDLLLVLGYISNLEYAWQIPELAAFLERLGSFSRLILMDRRGTGLSDRFGMDDAPSLEALNDDILAVLDAAGSVRAVVFGVWNGCQSAVALAASHPDRVSSLVLFSSAPRGAGDLAFEWTDQQWDQWLAEVRTGWGTRAWSIKHIRWQTPTMLEDARQVDQWVTWERLSASPSSAVAMYRVHQHTDLTDILPTVRTPTLVLHRAGDNNENVAAGKQVAALIPGARFVELAGDDTIPWIGDSEAILGEVERFVNGEQRHVETGRVLATVLFTDIVGSTRRAAELGDQAWRSVMGSYDRITREEIERHRGRWVHSTGDGMLARFDGPARAVRCAQAIARGVAQLGLEIRAGAHTGEVELLGDDIGGIAVHIGARVGALAGPGEVWASSTVKDLTAGSGLLFEDRGEHELKGVPDLWRLYRVAGG